ncbi:MAG: nitronate monooxygenase, partial [Bacteroidetes bacterium]|nr:nitronate monooxygenase [Bacteroidota bacterium]
TRLVKNSFFEQVNEAEKQGKPVEEMKELLGRGRAKKGMFEGDLENGELEIGQVSAQIGEILPVSIIMKNLITDYLAVKQKIENGGGFLF